MSPPLTPEDWIAAAFRRLGQGGIDAVRAEALARDLGVSKGSFYWHFRDLADLRARMLAHWQDQATARILSMAQAGGGDGAAQLRRLVALATSDLAEPYGGLSTEAAIRDWARRDPEAASVQGQVDRARLDFVTGLFRAVPLAPDAAARAARLVLMAYTGAVHLPLSDRALLAGDLQALLARLLSPPDPR